MARSRSYLLPLAIGFVFASLLNFTAHILIFSPRASSASLTSGTSSAAKAGLLHNELGKGRQLNLNSDRQHISTASKQRHSSWANTQDATASSSSSSSSLDTGEAAGADFNSESGGGEALNPDHIEVWARGVAGSDPVLATAVKALLTADELQQLEGICSRTLYHTLTGYVQVHGIDGPTFVATGDIPEMWIRDSSVQVGIYLPRIALRPALRYVVEGAIRTQAYFILQDPWANSYFSKYKPTSELTKFERLLGRGGWVATRNFEADSGAYFMHFLYNYAVTPGLYRPELLLSLPLIYDAVSRMVDVWTIEQRHGEGSSPYRYSELPEQGKGTPVKYTGMVWAGFRPSDDPQVYGFNIPVNMYVASGLARVLQLNRRVWKCPSLQKRVQKLHDEVRAGITLHGIVSAADGSKIYAYEVDGLGGALHSTDDPNVPSLLSIPLLGYDGYDVQVWENTKQVLYSTANPTFYSGSVLSGLGSTHTPSTYVWPLAHMVLGLTSSNATLRADIFRSLLKMQGDNGLMHESVCVNAPKQLTRPVFEWANALYVSYYETTLGVSCDAAAEAARLEALKARETGDKSAQPRNGDKDDPLYYATLEDSIKHV